MVLDPAELAVTSPVDAFTETTAGLLLLQDPVPPLNTAPFSENISDWFTQSGDAPFMDATEASGKTVSAKEAEGVASQPPVIV
jgi:hypothetical protein